MRKQDLRSEYRNLRKLVSESSLLVSSLAIANASLLLPIWDFGYFHIFLPISQQKEIDTHFILSILQGRDKNVVLPKVTGNDSLKHFLLTDATKFQTNRWNIPEPVDGIEITTDKIDVVFVPLLAFDKKGNRVGYGKGFYDIFLRECRKDVKKIGVSLFEAEDIIEDIDANDIPLDYCVTPQKTYSFSDSVLAT
ncbi:5-formyltetrahydrofolate cyclo-ligase [Pricia sp.]|uniref:5-formyltetrahydrofolate cyclo-ligase n=1 Tax=Pricia sp. TaxID=2268138 RepID=UPI003593DD10